MCKKNPIGTVLTCAICGGDYTNTATARPKDYCSDICRNFNKYKNAMERELLKITFQDNYSNQNKGELFRIANLIKIKRGL